MGIIANILSLLDEILKHPSLIVAVLALLVAFWSAFIARKTMQGNLYIRFIEEYASAEMCRALRMLKGAHKNLQERDEKLGTETKNFKTSRLADPETVEEARRLVKYYFFKALRLKKLGFFSKKLMKEVGSVAGINILYDIVKKYETDPKAKSTIEEIRKICGRYDEGGNKGRKSKSVSGRTRR